MRTLNRNDAEETQVWAQARMRESEKHILLDAQAAVGNIPLMPLKGMWLRHWAYAHPMQRSMGDVDVLIPASRLGQADYRLRQGKVFVTEYEADHAFTYRHRPTGVHLDLHRHLFAYGMFNMPTDLIFRRGELATLHGVQVRRMKDEDVFCHLLGHMVTARKATVADRDRRDFLALEAGGVTVDVIADAIVRYGLLRPARYVLPKLGDPFSEKLLQQLPGGHLPRMVEHFAPFAFEKGTQGVLAALAMHLLAGGTDTALQHAQYVRTRNSDNGRRRLAQLVQNRNS